MEILVTFEALRLTNLLAFYRLVNFLCSNMKVFLEKLNSWTKIKVQTMKMESECR